MEEFYGFFALQKDERSRRGIPITSSNLDMDTLADDIDDAEQKEEHIFCTQFLVDSEFEKREHCVFDFAMSSFNSSFFNEKLFMLEQLK